MFPNPCDSTKEDLRTALKEVKSPKKFPLVIKSAPWEGIFVDDNGVNCTSLGIVCAKKYFTQIIFEHLVL